MVGGGLGERNGGSHDGNVVKEKSRKGKNDEYLCPIQSKIAANQRSAKIWSRVLHKNRLGAKIRYSEGFRVRVWG
jgi:hypothetical protein